MLMHKETRPAKLCLEQPWLCVLFTTTVANTGYAHAINELKPTPRTARISTAHGTTDSEFVLQYDGDNLTPYNVRLTTGNVYVMQLNPKPRCEPALQHLVDPAKATTFHIAFDFTQVRKEYQSSFKGVGKAARATLSKRLYSSKD